MSTGSAESKPRLPCGALVWTTDNLISSHRRQRPPLHQPQRPGPLQCEPSAFKLRSGAANAGSDTSSTQPSHKHSSQNISLLTLLSSRTKVICSQCYFAQAACLVLQFTCGRCNAHLHPTTFFGRGRSSADAVHTVSQQVPPLPESINPKPPRLDPPTIQISITKSLIISVTSLPTHPCARDGALPAFVHSDIPTSHDVTKFPGGTESRAGAHFVPRHLPPHL